MRLPFRRRRRVIAEPRYPDVEFRYADKKYDASALAGFVRARLAENVKIVERFARSRGRSPLTEGFNNVLRNHELETGRRDDPVEVLNDYIAERRARLGAVGTRS